MNSLTGQEAFAVSMIRLNNATPRKQRKVSFYRPGLEITIDYRHASNLWGRFGGGWQWEFGFQAAGRTLILRCLFFSVFFRLKRRTGK